MPVCRLAPLKSARPWSPEPRFRDELPRLRRGSSPAEGPDLVSSARRSPFNPSSSFSSSSFHPVICCYASSGRVHAGRLPLRGTVLSCCAPSRHGRLCPGLPVPGRRVSIAMTASRGLAHLTGRAAAAEEATTKRCVQSLPPPLSPLPFIPYARMT
ncbi:hypothetical protein SSYM_1861 [Serratia symbiotica str. Tucson]|uniref:Uncharacterized protein n=1 Tax=Serratia symbiotica str. Tucson TaxID=914128 RepID=E9CN87_9GAMM|nr:hypothetical protein SSYM_1861 [Serratia symbiotica str. Tucson]